MADVRSVHTHLQHYERHLARLEELRELLQEQLTAALSRPQPAGATTGTTTGATADARTSEIEAALDRMDRGIYGTCRGCGTFIAYEQLLRMPYRSICDRCALQRGHQHD
ncbi:TraR/DksA family transcriptional regulator [Nonomuraea mesophila]|uniref:TraR/DksA family transcriptional regulator n=1 Tax=Nonomuraea mesophila TaxID=2530382 RepID=UPI00140C681E|nr:TraR/DksA C4-type zinc finger protein [Nonomuraea mesophila]